MLTGTSLLWQPGDIRPEILYNAGYTVVPVYVVSLFVQVTLVVQVSSATLFTTKNNT